MSEMVQQAFVVSGPDAMDEKGEGRRHRGDRA